MPDSFGLRYEGLREIAQALRETDQALLSELKHDLGLVGDVVKDDAATTFADKVNAKTAAGFETRVRATSSYGGLVTVEQRLRKTTGKRPDYGALQVKYLLRARDAKLDEAAETLENGAYQLLRRHGF